MKIKIIFRIPLVFLLLTCALVKAQSPIDPKTAPYYGTDRYPFWGKYGPVPMTQVKPQSWSNADGVSLGWDWSLPTFIKPPQHSAFSLLRTGVRGNSVSLLNALQKPSFPCKPSVAFWVEWKDLEAVEGTYTFNQLISNIKLANSKGYQSVVRIHSSATIFAPGWMGNFGITTTVGSKVTNYDIKNPAFHNRYLKLVEAIGKSGIPQMPEVNGLYVGYASGSYGDEGIGPNNGSAGIALNDVDPIVRARLDAWANITKGIEYKVFMGGESFYGQNKGFGVRRGFVEMYMNNMPNDYLGQKIDSNGYLFVDETVSVIKNNLFNGDENEEYGTDIASAQFNFRFGPTTESFNYRYFSSSIRVLQMRTNELLNHKDAVMPELTAWVGQNLGRTVADAPDVFCFLRETRVLSTDVKNFERWLYQRDAPGYITVPTKKIFYDNYQSTNVRSINGEAMHDKIARQGKKIGFNIDKNWPGVKGSMAFKVSVFDDNAGTINLKYSNGAEIVTLTRPLLGDQLLKTYTFIISDFKIGANIGGRFDFTLEAGDTTNNLVVSFVRVVQSEESLSMGKVGSSAESPFTVYPNPTTEILNFDFTTGEKSREIKVFNAVGQIVYSIKTKSASTQIDLKSLHLSGLILVQVLEGKTVFSKKIIVN